MTFGDFKNEIARVIENIPKSWRKGQAVFNYIESKYGVARAVQFEDGIEMIKQMSSYKKHMKEFYTFLVLPNLKRNSNTLRA